MNYIYVDSCEAEVTTLNTMNTTLSFSWNAVPLGSEFTINCPCTVQGCDIGRPLPVATRRCAGNFNSGGYWDLPLINNCIFGEYNFNTFMIHKINDNYLLTNIADIPVIEASSPFITGIASQPLTISFEINRDYPFPISGGIIWTLETFSGNQTLFNSTQFYIISPGTLIISSLQLEYEGTYFLTVTNAFGSVTDSIEVTVLGLCRSNKY